MTDSTDRICKCSDHYEIEMQTNGDCIEFVCAECIAASTIAGLETERDTLRKMVDAFADCSDCGDEWLMADYRELPHVRARKTK
jgi:hypothetical protein